jgi:hypothetical protein
MAPDWMIRRDDTIGCAFISLGYAGALRRSTLVSCALRDQDEAAR